MRSLPELPLDQLALSEDGLDLVYTFDAKTEQTGIAGLLRQLSAAGVEFADLQTRQSSLEDIFMSLVSVR